MGEYAMPVLSKDEIEQYDHEGYLVVENLLSEKEVNDLRDRFREYTHGGRPHGDIRFQLEPGAAQEQKNMDVPGDSYRKAEGLVEQDDLFQKLGTLARVS